MDDHAGAAENITDGVHAARFVRLRTALGDDRQIGIVEPFGDGAGADHAADVRRDDDQVLVLATPDFAEQHRAGVDVVDRDIEEALNRSEEHTSELQSLMRISYAVFCLKKKNTT